MDKFSHLRSLPMILANLYSIKKSLWLRILKNPTFKLLRIWPLIRELNILLESLGLILRIWLIKKEKWLLSPSASAWIQMQHVNSELTKFQVKRLQDKFSLQEGIEIFLQEDCTLLKDKILGQNQNISFPWQIIGRTNLGLETN